MPAGRKLTAAVCAAAAAGAALTGCQGDDDKGSGPIVVPAATTAAKAEPFADMTASELLHKAEQDMRDAGALTYEIAGSDHGALMHLKAAVTSKGACVAAFDLDGAKGQLIVPDGSVLYLKGDRDFWKQNGQGGLAPRFSDKWVRIPASAFDHGELSGMCDLDVLMDSLTDGDADDGTTVTRDPATTWDGKQVIPVRQTDADSYTVTLDISTGATPYVVRSVDRSEDAPGSITFGDFGKEPRITVPPHAQTVDPEDFGHKGGLHI